MKTIIVFFSILVSLSAFAGDGTSEQLIGHWQYTNEVKKGTSDLTFRRDGTFSGKVALEGKVVWEFAGKWSLQDRTLSYDHTSSSGARIPIGTKDRDEIVEVTKTYFICRGIVTHGPDKKYVRVE
jgi:hypothetical protein